MEQIPNKLVLTLLVLMTLITMISTFSFFHAHNSLPSDDNPSDGIQGLAVQTSSPESGRVAIKIINNNLNKSIND
ncbi:MAG: hypothetical protein ACLFUO_05625 [Candidatus Woesearchaeota archaeon]